MKKGNRYRRQGNVKILEKALSIRDALFSRLAVRRGAKRLRKIFFLLLLIIPVCYGIFRAVTYTIDKAYSLSIDHVDYASARGFITKEHVMKMLGIEGAINMATLDASGMEAALTSNPCIESAHIRAELPDTLSIEIEERIPIVYVEMENAADRGQRQKLFMDPHGYLFPVMPEYHVKVMELPVWYLNASDVKDFKPGTRIDENLYRPITELVSALNSYQLTQIPPVREIFRSKSWKIVLTLEGGISVIMQVYGIYEQVDRLHMILEHARATGKKLSAINVVPAINPTATFIEPETEKEEDTDAKKDKETKSSVRKR